MQIDGKYLFAVALPCSLHPQDDFDAKNLSMLMCRLYMLVMVTTSSIHGSDSPPNSTLNLCVPVPKGLSQMLPP